MPGLKCDLLTLLREKEGRTVRSESSLYSKCSLPSICLLNAHQEGGKKCKTLWCSPESRTLDRLHWCHIKEKKEGRLKKHEALNNPFAMGQSANARRTPSGSHCWPASERTPLLRVTDSSSDISQPRASQYVRLSLILTWKAAREAGTSFCINNFSY